MSWSLDARIPVRLLAPTDLAAAISAASAPFALLVPGALDVIPGQAAAVIRFAPDDLRHVAACACCAGRAPAAVGLDQLFQARIRGNCSWFARVLALAPDSATRQQVEAALRDDPLTTARFRPG
jgi:hypothetical protein